MSIRSKRIAGAIRKVISESLIRGAGASIPGFLTVSDVEVSPDRRHAKIFLSVFGADGDKSSFDAHLPALQKEFRHEIACGLDMRRTPNVHVVIDDTLQRAARLNDLLRNNLPDEAE